MGRAGPPCSLTALGLADSVRITTAVAAPTSVPASSTDTNALWSTPGCTGTRGLRETRCPYMPEKSEVMLWKASGMPLDPGVAAQQGDGLAIGARPSSERASVLQVSGLPRLRRSRSGWGSGGRWDGRLLPGDGEDVRVVVGGADRDGEAADGDAVALG